MEWLQCAVVLMLVSQSHSENVYNFSLTECTSARTFDIVEDEPTSITCTGLVPGHNIYWSIISHRGVETRVGQCVLCLDCSPQCSHNFVNCNQACESSPGYQITRHQGQTTLHFRNNLQNNAGAMVKCSSWNNATQATCFINFITANSIPNCANNEVTVIENGNAILGCTGLNPLQSMYWAITDTAGNSHRIAECGPRQVTNPLTSVFTQCQMLDADYRVTRSSVSSRVQIIDNRRQKNGWMLRCSVSSNVASAVCRVRVQYPAVVSRLNFTQEGWNVNGTAVIDKVFDSNNNVTCIWVLYDRNLSYQLTVTRPTLSAFVEKEGGPLYYNGTCTVSFLMKETEGLHQLFAQVVPGSNSSTVGTTFVVKPGTLVLNSSTCPSFAAEGSRLECQCQHQGPLLGSPRPTITWGSVHSSPVLDIDSVDRRQNGTVYTCRSTWGPMDDVVQTHNFTLLVAYGPTKAVVQSHTDYTDNVETATLTCSLDDAYPSTQFNWSVPCVTLNSSSKVSTCSVAIATLDDVTEVTCVAYNSLFTNLNASAVYRIPSATLKQSQDVPVASVAGGTVAGVVLLVIGVIVVVCFVRRKKSPKPTRANQNEEFEEYINDTYDSTGDIEPPGNIPSPTTPTTSLENARNNQQRSDEPASSEDIPYVNTASVAVASNSSDVYAKVMKNERDKTLETPSKDVQSKANETYAQVQKKLKGENASRQAELSALKREEFGQRETAKEQDENRTAQAESAKLPTEYANCPEEASSGSVYVNVRKSSCSYANEVGNKGLDTDDDYNRLRCTKTGVQEGTSPYNHLGDC